MKTIRTKFNSIDEYIAGFPEGTQRILEQIRATVKKAAPEADETIKYEMPTFTLKGNLIHFAAFKNHIGFYPIPKGNEELTKDLLVYRAAKGTLRFPIDKPIPLELISRVVKFRVKENQEKRKTKIHA